MKTPSSSAAVLAAMFLLVTGACGGESDDADTSSSSQGGDGDGDGDGHGDGGAGFASMDEPVEGLYQVDDHTQNPAGCDAEGDPATDSFPFLYVLRATVTPSDGPFAEGEPCNGPSDCASGLACVDDVCGGCTTDLDCQPTLNCDEQSGQCLDRTFVSLVPCDDEASCMERFEAGEQPGGAYLVDRFDDGVWVSDLPAFGMVTPNGDACDITAARDGLAAEGEGLRITRASWAKVGVSCDGGVDGVTQMPCDSGEVVRASLVEAW